MPFQPWSWKPRQDSWYSKLAESARRWEPQPELNLERAKIQLALVSAAEERSSWLMHPCATALTAPGTGECLQRDLQMAVWVASHSQHPLGTVEVPTPQWLWTATGGQEIAAGEYGLQDLANLDNTIGEAGLQLDVWCTSMGVVLRHSWAELTKLSEADAQQLESEIVAFLNALRWAAAGSRPIGAWIDSVTRIAIPLHSPLGENQEFRSMSEPDFAGLVQLDLFGGPMQILEALVHESAHRHLYLAEAESPLIEPDWDGRYRSPLRPDARPLRGILMAYHALAYICCLFKEIPKGMDTKRRSIEKELTALLDGMTDAENTMKENRAHLTSNGNQFLDQTLQVAEYARS